MHFTSDEIAIIYDALYHLECTTDVYSNPYDEMSKKEYTDAFRSAFSKINSYSDEKKMGAFYFE
ncbi:hypothetical protein [Staphylococcus equorum]|uniref:hypothetical protein n=1 Tax=Staphylococcus equorum TaxID=246432 RepID=UPI00203FC17B|nr:hypothetical protein [Staphylococcus equorum]MCM3071113.1 hypothetical protein [Staphylococcus equorum]MDK9870058.1 hypothetical protein [Staphylococcus equorum]